MAEDDYERFHQTFQTWTRKLAGLGTAIDLAMVYRITPERWNDQRRMYREAFWKTNAGAAWKITLDPPYTPDPDLNRLDVFLEKTREEERHGMLHLYAGIKVLDAMESNMGILPPLHEIADHQRHELPATSNKAREYFWAVFDLLKSQKEWKSYVEIYRSAAAAMGIRGPKAQNRRADSIRAVFQNNNWHVSHEPLSSMLERVQRIGSAYDG